MPHIDDATHDGNSTVVDLAQRRQSKTNVPVPARIADRVDQLRKIIGQIGSKEADVKSKERDVKADNLAILKLALNAGGHLIAIKNDISHCKFGKWVETNLDCSAVTARKYMRLAEWRDLIEEQIETGSVFSIRGALRLINSKKPPKQNGTESVGPKGSSTEAPQVLSVEARAQLIASLGITSDDVPAAVKAEIVQYAVARERFSANARLTSLDRLINSVHSTEATQMAEERKNAKILAKFKAFVKNDRAPPVCDLIDREASLGSAVKPGTTKMSPIPSDPEITTAYSTKH